MNTPQGICMGGELGRHAFSVSCKPKSQFPQNWVISQGRDVPRGLIKIIKKCHTKNVKQLVLRQAALIKKSGCDGIVCSAKEALMVRKRYKNLLIITPGIRLPGDSSNDQLRVMTPKQAFENKVSGIVIGRSLTKGNIRNNTKKLIDHLNKWSKVARFVV